MYTILTHNIRILAPNVLQVFRQYFLELVKSSPEEDRASTRDYHDAREKSQTLVQLERFSQKKRG